MIKRKTQNAKRKTRNRRGAALLVVLFMIMAVVVISLGILYRADMAAAGGHNYALRTQADYIAWGGLEHARALILADNKSGTLNAPVNPQYLNNNAPAELDGDENFSFILEPAYDPQTITNHPQYDLLWRYDLVCKVRYDKTGATTRPFSELSATILYNPDTQRAWFTNIRRPQE